VRRSGCDGDPPFSFQFHGIHGSANAVFALGFDGSRRERLPTIRTEAGSLRAEIDTARLDDGPTAFFEIVVDTTPSTDRK